MSILAINKAIKDLNSRVKSKKRICTKAEIYSTDKVLSLKTNGVPSIISIAYNGRGLFKSLMPPFIKVIEGKNKIIINNLFRKAIPVNLISYEGDITISKCIIFSQDSSKLSATIFNNEDSLKLNKSDTNFEDDSNVLFEELPERKAKLSLSGLSRKKINKNLLNSPSNFPRYGQKEIEQFSTLIKEILPSISVKTKDQLKSKQALNITKTSEPISIIPKENKIKYGNIRGNLKKIESKG